MVAFFGWFWISEKPNAPPPGPKPYQANPTPAQYHTASTAQHRTPTANTAQPASAQPATSGPNLLDLLTDDDVRRMASDGSNGIMTIPATTPARSAYVRPIAAPNGSSWPSSAGYIAGYRLIKNNGLSIVTVDNSRNASDVFVKLVSLDGAQAYPVRQFYIPAFDSFTLNNVTAGSYDIRYRDLGNGGLSCSESFNVEEISTDDEIQYSNMTMTLYKVKNGNMQTYGLSEAEF